MAPNTSAAHRRALAEGTLETSRALRVKQGLCARVRIFGRATARDSGNQVCERHSRPGAALTEKEGVLLTRHRRGSTMGAGASVDEREDEQGLAHLVEHVTILGSKKRDA